MDKLIVSLLLAENFGDELRKVLEELKVSVKEFSEISGISQSTLYKLLSREREPNLRTLRKIAKVIKGFEREDSFIALIASRSVLNQLTSYEIKIKGTKVSVKEYPANSLEEAIVAAIKAEREGAKAVVCAPIVSPTLEKILRIPIVTIIPKNDLLEALKIAAEKISSQSP